MPSPSDDLPINAVLPELLDALRTSDSAVLRAPTGAGKTTRVPPALLDAGLCGDGAVIVVQPRRLAARAAARRIADERDCFLGQEVGYVVRFDRRVGRDTRLIVMTEGVLLRRLQSDPFLEGVVAVVFDEFHERNLNSDLALAMARRVQQTVRPELKIVVMSATLDPQPVAEYLGGCPAVASEGRLYPVDIEYLRRRDPRELPELIAEGLSRVLPRTDGDVLVFLPGVGEIKRTTRRIESLAREFHVVVRELFGDLPPEQQDAALWPGPQRKIVLSTNVAETSITIEGVTVVVDSGLARTMRFDPAVGLDRLELGPISKASADQRTGRAGRVRPGFCLRLWDEASNRIRPDAETPEIRRVDLSGPVLQLLAWGESDVRAFPWFEAPDETAFEQAEALLRRLGAVDESGVTDLGRKLVRLPVQPRIGRLLIEGQRLDCVEAAALTAAMLTERDPFLRTAASGVVGGRAAPSGGGSFGRTSKSFGKGPPRGKKARRRHAGMSGRGSGASAEGRDRSGSSESDIVERVRALQQFKQTGTTQFPFGEINVSVARFMQRTQQQLVRELRESLVGSGDDPGRDADAAAAQSGGDIWDAILGGAAPESDDALMQALLAAFPDRLVKRRGPRESRGVLANGHGVRLAPQCGVSDAELLLAIDVEGGRGEAIVRKASAVEREWLPIEQLRTVTESFFHPSQKKVVAKRRTYWDQLLLDETGIEVTPNDETADVLFREAVAAWEQVFPSDDTALMSFLNRTACLREWLPELELPDLDRAFLEEVLCGFCRTSLSFAELKSARWLDAVKARFDWQQLTSFDQEAPEKLTLPNDRQYRLQYEAGRPPILAVKIQDAFGLTESPRIARGRVPVLLHLLAPNNRPQQITDDLASFWKNGYPQVRKDLRGRYPKHAWPEDPFEMTNI
ncbi:DEAD/DEAH box helicase [bacterium]|nr:DEAD/DEAH box helicase [bacterium]